MSLFLSQPSLEKTAAAYSLHGRPEQWEGEILANLHKQAPYLGTYRLDLTIAQENREAGYLLGYFIVSPQDLPAAATNGAMAAPVNEVNQGVVDGSTPGVRIPVIVVRTNSASVLEPFDIMLDAEGQAQPLTEGRLAAVMASAPQFQVTQRPQGAEDMGQQEPPVLQGTGRVQNIEKTSSLLAKVASRLTEVDVALFKEQLNSPEVLYAISTNDHFASAVSTLIHRKEKTASRVINPADEVEPTVLLVKQASGGYDVSSASHHAYSPVSMHVPYEHASALPPEVLRAVAEHGMVMYQQEEPGRGESMTGAVREITAGVTKEAGRHLVPCESGTEVCRVIPHVYDSLARRTEEVLIVKQASKDGAHACTLAYVAPTLAGAGLGGRDEQANWVQWQPGNTQVKVAFVSPDLSACTEPMSLTRRRGPDGSVSYLSGGLSVTKAASLSRPIFHNNVLCVPESWAPVAVRGDLAPVDGELRKTAALLDVMRDELIVHHSGAGEYELRGAAVAALPEEERSRLPKMAALLLLGAAGFPLHEGVGLIKKAERLGATSCSTKRRITPMHVRQKEAKEKVARLIAPLRVDLVKEAAALAGAQAIDTVLSLNFVNADNLSVFLDKRPDLEATLRTLCDLLLQSRMGLDQDVKKGAVERAVKGLTDVLTGLDDAEMRMQAP